MPRQFQFPLQPQSQTTTEKILVIDMFSDSNIEEEDSQELSINDISLVRY